MKTEFGRSLCKPHCKSMIPKWIHLLHTASSTYATVFDLRSDTCISRWLHKLNSFFPYPRPPIKLTTCSFKLPTIHVTNYEHLVVACPRVHKAILHQFMPVGGWSQRTIGQIAKFPQTSQTDLTGDFIYMYALQIVKCVSKESHSSNQK